MSFNWNIIGHQRQIKFLQNQITANKIAHAYLFSGTEHLGKLRIVLEFAKSIECAKTWTRRELGLFENKKNDEKKSKIVPCRECQSCQTIQRNINPDVFVIKPDTNTISINQIREIIHKLSFFPYQSPFKIAIVDNAQTMTQEAANALLKTLEEPPEKSIIILVCSDQMRLPPTVVSRCQIINFWPVAQEEIKKGLTSIFLYQKPKVSDIREGDSREVGMVKIESPPEADDRQRYSEVSENIMPIRHFETKPEKLNLIVKYSFGKPGLAIILATNTEQYEAKIKLQNDLLALIDKPLIKKISYIQKISQDFDLVNETLDTYILFFRDLLLAKKNHLRIKNMDSTSPDFIPILSGRSRNSPQAELEKKYSIQKILDLIKNFNNIKKIINTSNTNTRLALEVALLAL